MELGDLAAGESHLRNVAARFVWDQPREGEPRLQLAAVRAEMDGEKLRGKTGSATGGRLEAELTGDGTRYLLRGALHPPKLEIVPVR